MVALSRAGIKRKERKRRILRSWRLQTIFLLVAVLIPTISMIMMECGWKSLDEAWEEVRHVVDDVEALAFRGWNVLDSLQETQHGFYNNTLVQEILQSKNKLIFQDWCPNTATSGESSSFSLKFLQDGINSIQSNAHYLVDVLDPSSGGTSWNKNAFIVTTQVTKYLDESITWFFDHDWLLKLFLMIINVLNILMLLSCYFLSKNNIIHAPSRMYLSVVVLPLFIIFTIMLLFITSTSGVATLMNADFCAGGPGPSGSPQGTIEDAILSYQYGRMERQQVTGNLGLIYDSFLYFSEV